MDDANLHDEALDWLIRVGDPRFADWDALTAWLARSPGHARVFNALQLAEAELVDGLREAGALVSAAGTGEAADFANDNTAPSSGSWHQSARIGYWAAGIAAALIIGVGLTIGLSAWDKPGQAIAWQEYRTAAGERRDVRTEDGTVLALNGNTAVRLDPAGRRATLESGEALFIVRHDAARPFVLKVGETTITDLGTRFDVTRVADRLTVRVAEGAVAVGKGLGDAGIVVKAGQGVDLAGSMQRRFAVLPDAMAGWRAGRLRYDDAPAPLVVDDVARATGVRVDLDAAAQARRFTGTISLDGSRAEIGQRVRLLLGAGGSAD